MQDLTGFDEIAAMFADGDLDALAARIDGALSDAGAAELVSSVANAVSERLPATDDDLSSEFLDAYAHRQRPDPRRRSPDRQLASRSSGASASQARRPGWRRRTARHSSSGSDVKTSFGSGSRTSQAPASISPSSWPGPQPE